MPKYWIEFRAVAYAEYEIEAESQEDAEEIAWRRIEEDAYDMASEIDWDLDYVGEVEE